MTVSKREAVSKIVDNLEDLINWIAIKYQKLILRQGLVFVAILGLMSYWGFGWWSLVYAVPAVIVMAVLAFLGTQVQSASELRSHKNELMKLIGETVGDFKEAKSDRMSLKKLIEVKNALRALDGLDSASEMVESYRALVTICNPVFVSLTVVFTVGFWMQFVFMLVGSFTVFF